MLQVADRSGHRLSRFEVDTRKPVDAATETCLRQRVGRALATSTTPPGDLVIELRVRMRR